MSKDLTNSNIDRQNILNNRYALESIKEKYNFPGFYFEEEYKLTKKMVSDFYDIDERTIDRYIESNNEELSLNGYELLRGNRLKELKLRFGNDIDVATKTTVLGLFNFRSFLNIGMLLTESEKAKILRSNILDIVIESINKRTGGGTKYINRRDASYTPTALMEINYRKKFTNAINICVNGHHTMKYATATDYIYKAIFKENAREYKKILKLKEKENVRSTFYTEIMLLVSAFENGVAYEIEKQYNSTKKKLQLDDVKRIIADLAMHPMQRPIIDDARSKMASRDLCFRDAMHDKLSEYISSVSKEDFDKFIGEQSIDFEKILEENKDVLLRLKQDSSNE